MNVYTRSVEYVDEDEKAFVVSIKLRLACGRLGFA